VGGRQSRHDKEAAMPAQPIPPGYHTVTPYLVVRGGEQALEFYKRAFGATELFRMADPSGKIGHAEIRIGDSTVMLADEFPEVGAVSQQTAGGSSVGLYLYVENVDALTAQAIAAGATVERPVKDEFYGDRSGTLRDPFGHKWTIATHIEDVSPAEIELRAKAMQAPSA
jgi:PhnB protein